MNNPGSASKVERGSATLDRLLRMAAALTVMFSVLTAIDTRLHFIELFSHFRGQYLVVSLLLLIVFAVRRQAKYSLLLVVVLAVNATYVLPWYFKNGTPAGEAGIDVTFLYANVLSSNRDHVRLIDLIDDERPDVIVLQEVSTQWLETLLSLADEYPFSYTEARDDNFGIALWSRLPLASAMHVDSPPLGFPTIIATTRIDGRDVTLVSTHPINPLGRENFLARNRQLQSVAEIVGQAHGEVLLIGDLNASVWDRHYRHFAESTGLSNARRGSGILPTWPTFMPFAMIPIDHVLVSSGIEIADIRTGPRIGSDHLPLIVTVVL